MSNAVSKRNHESVTVSETRNPAHDRYVTGDFHEKDCSANNCRSTIDLLDVLPVGGLGETYDTADSGQLFLFWHVGQGDVAGLWASEAPDSD